jgi:hypothetical protein
LDKDDAPRRRRRAQGAGKVEVKEKVLLKKLQKTLDTCQKGFK